MPFTTETLETRALSRILERFKGQSNIETIIRLGVEPLQEIEDTIATVMSETLDNAVGVWLEYYGELVGRPRVIGWSDTDYRRYIKLRIRALASKGTAPEIIDLAADMRPNGETEIVEYIPQYPANYELRIPNVPAAERDQFTELISIATPAGVRGSILFWETANPPLTYDRSPGSTYGWDAGVYVEYRSTT